MHRISENTNAQHVVVRARSIAKPRTKSRFRRVAEILVEGPSSIRLRRNVGDYERLSDFQQTFHVQLESKLRLSSWTIYEETEGRIPGCVLRHASWETQAADRLQPWNLEDVPKLELMTYYVPRELAELIVRDCAELDAVLALSGFAFEQRTSVNKLEWYNVSLFRLFDYGSVTIRWNYASANYKYEAIMFRITQGVEAILIENGHNQAGVVETLELIYDCVPPEVMELFAVSE